MPSPMTGTLQFIDDPRPGFRDISGFCIVRVEWGLRPRLLRLQPGTTVPFLVVSDKRSLHEVWVTTPGSDQGPGNWTRVLMSLCWIGTEVVV